jgi:hypothetical protein
VAERRRRERERMLDNLVMLLIFRGLFVVVFTDFRYKDNALGSIFRIIFVFLRYIISVIK